MTHADAERDVRPPMADIEPLPTGSRIVHIGPPKTGTTALQGALHGSRAALLEQGVRYAGPARHSRRAAEAVVGRRAPDGQVPGIEHWQALVDEVVGAAEARTIISSEFLASATEEHIRRIVHDLGADRIHVAVTLRPLARIIPGHWQQLVQTGARLPLDDFVHAILDRPDEGIGERFWWRQHHDRLLRRWADIVGLEHITVIVVDDADHDLQLRTFESLMGVRGGTLIADRDLVNRSLTAPEAAAMLAFNAAYAAEHKAGAHRLGALREEPRRSIKARTPDASEARVRLPDWATARVAAISDEVVDGVRRSGVRIVGGEVDLLRQAPGASASDGTEGLIPVDLAAVMAMGVLRATSARRETSLSHVASRRMLRMLARRAQRRIRELLGRPGAKPKATSGGGRSTRA